MKVIIFDLDRTLLNLTVSETIALKHIFTEHINTDITFTQFHDTYKIHNEKWWFKKSRYEATPDEVKVNRFLDTFNELNMTPKVSAETMAQHYLKEAENHWVLYSGAETCLKQLKAAGYRLGMITNGFTSTQNNKIERLGIRHYFEYICLSEESGFAKPDKRIFDHTSLQLNTVSENCIYIGDDYDSDVLGAKNAQMTPIWFNEDNKLNPQKYSEFSDYSKLFDLIKLLS